MAGSPAPEVRVAVAMPSLLGESPMWHPGEQALYYCDIPVRYARPDLGSVIDVKPIHCLFDDMAAHLG